MTVAPNVMLVMLHIFVFKYFCFDFGFVHSDSHLPYTYSARLAALCEGIECFNGLRCVCACSAGSVCLCVRQSRGETCYSCGYLSLSLAPPLTHTCIRFCGDTPTNPFAFIGRTVHYPLSLRLQRRRSSPRRNWLRRPRRSGPLHRPLPQPNF
jgi:hypothetical protein